MYSSVHYGSSCDHHIPTDYSDYNHDYVAFSISNSGTCVLKSGVQKFWIFKNIVYKTDKEYKPVFCRSFPETVFETVPL